MIKTTATALWRIVCLMVLLSGSAFAGEVGSHFTNCGEVIKVATHSTSRLLL